jgi:organic radical activating enzyme
MSLQIIKSNSPKLKGFEVKRGDLFIEMSELFADTIQGEGINIGAPATFLRVKGCTLSCSFCDTKTVWQDGHPYSFDHLFHLFEENELIHKFTCGQHLVLTGGSPLRQQKHLVLFIRKFIERYGFKPYIEIENECTLFPTVEMIEYVDCWNNSPKLFSSGNPNQHPEIIEQLARLPNSWFKFVVSSDEHWEEIEDVYLADELIRPDQVILMPLGATKAELIQNRAKVVDIAIYNNVRYCTREHVVIWDQATGV